MDVPAVRMEFFAVLGTWVVMTEVGEGPPWAGPPRATRPGYLNLVRAQLFKCLSLP